MTHPYHRAKPNCSTFEIPEVRCELLQSQRALYTLCCLENEGNQRGVRQATALFLELASDAFDENLHDLAEDVHNVCRWALRQEKPPQNILQTAILFAGVLLQHEQTAAAIPLLKSLETAPFTSHELRSLWAINSAVGFEKLTKLPNDELWTTAVQEMPLPRWQQYPSLAVGCRNLLRRLRQRHEDHGELQALLAAGPLAERAYAALTSRHVKATPFERSGDAVRLLIEIGHTRHAWTEDAFGDLAIPSSTRVLEQSAITAAVNTTEDDLFPLTLTILAQHYAKIGDREKARDTAAQGLAEYAWCRHHDPKVIQALQLIFHSNTE
jgi:hypothetical protein